MAWQDPKTRPVGKNKPERDRQSHHKEQVELYGRTL